mgnify:CR=1 FL=1
METLILIFHVVIALALIAVVLLQQGKGAETGAAFGSGASSTVFGARGSASFLTRSTAVLAALFFVTSLTLAILSGAGERDRGSVTDAAPPEQPASPAPGAADVPTLPGDGGEKSKP